MSLANTNGRKPLVFSLEHSQQMKRLRQAVYTLNSGSVREYGFGTPGIWCKIEKVMT